MISAQRNLSVWSPTTAEGRAEVVAELNLLLSHPQFSNSKRYPALLRYLVEHTLNGDIAQIKERTLGIEVFGRPATYDTTNDTVVRFTASEVRRRLSIYYLQHEDHSIHIVLPTGSYVPEFYRAEEASALAPAEPLPSLPAEEPRPPAPAETIDLPRELAADPVAPRAARFSRTQVLIASLLALVVVAAVVAFVLQRRSAHLAMDRFWGSLAHDAKPPLLIAGGSKFSDNLYSGVETATRDVDYPFVSLQIASAMSRASVALEREGSTPDLMAANVTTLNDIRDRPLVLIGAFNNPWTVRLTSQLPIGLSDPITHAFQERDGAHRRWKRDGSLPYSAADDYGLIGQYRDRTTGNMVVLMGGLGRNGTEAAAQFLTDERHLADLQKALGRNLEGASFEAILMVPVVQGRTGAPTLLTVRPL